MMRPRQTRHLLCQDRLDIIIWWAAVRLFNISFSCCLCHCHKIANVAPPKKNIIFSSWFPHWKGSVNRDILCLSWEVRTHHKHYNAAPCFFCYPQYRPFCNIHTKLLFSTDAGAQVMVSPLQLSMHAALKMELVDFDRGSMELNHSRAVSQWNQLNSWVRAEEFETIMAHDVFWPSNLTCWTTQKGE